MGEASLPSCHCVVLAVDCDAHGAEPGGPAGLTKPQQPAAGSRRAGVPQERRKAKFWRGVTNQVRLRLTQRGGLSSELPPKSRTGVRRAWSVSGYEVHRMFRNTELLKIAALFNVRVAFSHVIACRTPTAYMKDRALRVALFA